MPNIFASAHPARIAPDILMQLYQLQNFASAHPARIAPGLYIDEAGWVSLCLSTPRTDCTSKIVQMQCHKSTQYAVSW